MSRSLAYGLHPVRSMLAREPAGIARLLLLDPQRPPFAELAALAAEHGITVERRPAGTLDRLCGGAVHQGALALLSAPPQALDENALEAILAGAAQPLLLVLDEVQDPRNLGACPPISVSSVGASTMRCSGNHCSKKRASGAQWRIPSST